MGVGVLALVFLDEALAIVALGYVGAAYGSWLGATGLVLAAVALWWTFASPKAPRGGPVVRPVVTVLVFGAACLGLGVGRTPELSVALLAFAVVVNALAQTRGVRHALDTLDPQVDVVRFAALRGD